MDIKSDKQIAALHATALKQASTSLSNVTGATKDTTSNLVGNSKAHEVIDTCQRRAREVGQVH